MTSVEDAVVADADAPVPATDDAQYPRWVTALWLIPLALVVLIPGLRLQAFQTMYAFRVVPFLYTIPVVAAVALLVFAVLSRGFRSRIHWALGVTTMAVFVGFLHSDLNTAMAEVAGSAPSLVAEAAPVLIVVLALWVAARMASTRGYFVIVSLAVVAVFLGVALINAGTYVAVSDPPPAAIADPDAPDVLVMVLDGYARDDVFAERYGFDNEAFLTALADRGFTVPRNAAANYTGTHGALAAMYSLEYPVGEGPMTGADYDQMATILAGDNALMSEFSQAGYQITFLENGWEGSTCPPAAHECVRDGLWDKTLWDLGRLTLLSPLVEQRWADPFTSMAVPQFDRLIEIAGQPSESGSPRLIVAHVTLPHPPLHLDAACMLSNPPEARGLLIQTPGMSAEELDVRIDRYAEQTVCANALTLAALDRFLAVDPDGIVMITGDHGPDSMLQGVVDAAEWSPAAVTERAAVMSAYRVAPGCAGTVSDAITPVNGARLVHSCALGLPFTPIPNRTYTIPEAPGEVEQEVLDLTGRLAPNS
jgi:hypothetical protein